MQYNCKRNVCTIESAPSYFYFSNVFLKTPRAFKNKKSAIDSNLKFFKFQVKVKHSFVLFSHSATIW